MAPADHEPPAVHRPHIRVDLIAADSPDAVTRSLWVTYTSSDERSTGLGSCQRHDWDAGLVAKRCARLRAAVDRANRDGAVDAESSAEIERLGALLFDDLLPADLKRRLRDLEGGFLTIGLAPPLWDLPVELLHDGRDVLALRWALGRQLLTRGLGPRPQARPAAERHRIVVLADPDGSLPECYNEGVVLRRLLDRAERADVAFHSTRVGRELVREELRDFDAVHVAGHIDTSGLRLADGHFGGADVRSLAGGLPMPRLVVLNGCASGDGSMIRNGSLAGELLEAGVEHLVGALYEVPDTLARDLAIDFWTELGTGQPVGEALRRARLALARERGPSTAVWAAYALFGRPETIYGLGAPKDIVLSAEEDPDLPVLLDRARRPAPAPDGDERDRSREPFDDVLNPEPYRAVARLRAPARAAMARTALGQPRWLTYSLGVTTLGLLLGLLVALAALAPRLFEEEPPRSPRGRVVSEPAEVATVTNRPLALALLSETGAADGERLRLSIALEEPAFVALLAVDGQRVERLWPDPGADGWLAGGRHLLPPDGAWRPSRGHAEASVLVVRRTTPFDDADDLIVYLNALLSVWPSESATHNDIVSVVETVVEREGGVIDRVTY